MRKVKNIAVVSIIAVFMAAQFMLGGCASTASSGSAEQTETNKESDVAEVADTGEASDADAAEVNTPDSDEALADNTEADTDSEETAADEPEEEVPALRDCVPQVLGCRIGCEVTGAEADDDKVWEILTTHFDAVTLGNELKPDSLFNYSNAVCPGTETAELNGETMEVPKLNFDRAEHILDKLLLWNEENPDRKIMVRGHVLVWHSQTPEWFFHEGYDKKNDLVKPAEMNKRLEWYIKSVLEHFTGEDSKYKDMFYGWDVVNEAISDATGTYRSNTENTNEPAGNDTHSTNSTWWAVYQSNEYIINAFTYANKYAPENLELYYNDYNETNIIKRNGIIDLLTAVKEKEGAPGEGTRISGMGMQGHYGMSDPDPTAVEASMKMYSELVGSVQITEMDIKANREYDGSAEAKEEEYEKQRKRYNMFYYYMKSAKNAGANITGLTFWGTVDHYSWLQSQSSIGGGNAAGLKQCPLLFDENYEPKPCFWVFASAQ